MDRFRNSRVFKAEKRCKGRSGQFGSWIFSGIMAVTHAKWTWKIADCDGIKRRLRHEREDIISSLKRLLPNRIPPNSRREYLEMGHIQFKVECNVRVPISNWCVVCGVWSGVQNRRS
jgi:hypothetical protein